MEEHASVNGAVSLQPTLPIMRCWLRVSDREMQLQAAGRVVRVEAGDLSITSGMGNSDGGHQ